MPGPVLIVVLAVVAALLVGAASWLLGRTDDPHPPQSDDEVVMTSVALGYAQGLQTREADVACAFSTGAAADKLECGTEREKARPPCGPGDVLILHADETRAEIRVGACHLKLVSTLADWKVVDDVRD
jgi:hypothetical protein